ncbi:MAG: NAD(P)H-dependent oxidoreductase [Prevotellaceae bacterium]|jgi:nitroreductase|nr:NAD(P)H-dependent oxidoreductase [Prevotellaceae bacterium]
MTLLDSLRWRYATKRMTGTRIPDEKLNSILEAIRLSASSFGLQPYRVVVVSDKSVLNRIYTEACPQAQVEKCSHLLVFAAWTEAPDAELDRFVKLLAGVQHTPPEIQDRMKHSLSDFVKAKSAEELRAWTANQAYIALGFGLVAAATEQIDASPMEGFDADKMDKILGLKEKNLHASVIMALGYRDAANDRMASLPKMRRLPEELFIKV